MNTLVEKLTTEGYKVRGIIQVGANDWHELQFYKALGIANVLGFEPLPEAIERFHQKYPDFIQHLMPIALSNENVSANFYKTTGDGQGSSLLLPTTHTLEEHPEYKVVGGLSVTVNRFDRFMELNPQIKIADFNCAIIDTEGTELQVLQGMGEYLEEMDFLIVETPRLPRHERESRRSELFAFLENRDFVFHSWSDGENDAYFVREGVTK